jgi:hypothetical protein
MEIGGLHFAISGNIANVLQEPNPVYGSFSGKVNSLLGGRPADIRIRLQLGGMPGTENLEKLFDSGQSWSMFRDGAGYCLSLRPPAFKQPIWLARMNRDFTEATVYCSEKLVSWRNGSPELSNPVSYPLDQILLMYILARRQGALLHAAGIDINGRGYIFPGKSGAGKSTITRQFAALGDKGLLSDDRIVARKIDDDFKAYGTPWPGDAGIACNKSMPLAGIFFINHGSANGIKEITPQEALARDPDFL